jgi:hypothetical protein
MIYVIGSLRNPRVPEVAKALPCEARFSTRKSSMTGTPLVPKRTTKLAAV